MNKFLVKILSLLALLLLTLPLSSSAEESISWIYSYPSALKAASDEDKPIMIDFYTSWCGWCKKLDKETYRDERIIQLSRHFVCLKLDGDKYQGLARDYKVTGYPTVLFTDKNGNVVGGGAGYRDAVRMSVEMYSVLSGLKPRAVTEQADASGRGIIKSSTGSIGPFAKNYKRRTDDGQNGEYAEVRIKLDMPERFRTAELVLVHRASKEGLRGEANIRSPGAVQQHANANVYLSGTAQVAPEAKLYYKGDWWVGEAARLGEQVGSFTTGSSTTSTTRLNIGDFLQRHPSDIYYVAVQNLSLDDIALEQVRIEVKTE